MEKFLKKFMSDDQFNAFKESYLKANPNAKDLPVFIGKERLDEVLAKEHAAEASVADLTKQLEDLKSAQQSSIDKAVKEANDAATKHEAEALEAQKKDFGITEAIWNAKGKNTKAIRALMDTTKDPKTELERIKKSDPYLFDAPADHLPDGTGRGSDGQGTKLDAEMQAMRKAVGI